MNLTKKITYFTVILCCCLWLGNADIVSAKNHDYSIKVYSGAATETIEWLESIHFWGAQEHDEDLAVPRIIIVVADKRWKTDAGKLPVASKKELFYRTLLPLILFNNELISEERNELSGMRKQISRGKSLTAKEETRLRTIAVRYKYDLQETISPAEQITQLLNRVDIVPPSLALGQSAYESGYGTSRFATEGNALFGQWTYGGGMKPQEHRAHKGNYGVAAYDWPFDSVREYMRNLNSHKAYQALRDRRALLRKQGKEITGMKLAETLDKYSERGVEYVKTLQSIIRVNELEVADQTYLRDESITLVVETGHTEKIAETEAELEELRASGELDRIIQNMHLHPRNP